MLRGGHVNSAEHLRYTSVLVAKSATNVNILAQIMISPKKAPPGSRLSCQTALISDGPLIHPVILFSLTERPRRSPSFTEALHA